MQYENFWRENDGRKVMVQQLCPDVLAMMFRTETADGEVIDGLLSGSEYNTPFTVSAASPYKPRGMANNGVSVQRSSGGILVVNAGVRASELIEKGKLDPVEHDYNAGLETLSRATPDELRDLFAEHVAKYNREASEMDFEEMPPCRRGPALMIGTKSYFAWSAVERGADVLASYLERDASRVRAVAIAEKAGRVAGFYRSLQSVAKEGCDSLRGFLFQASPQLTSDLEEMCDELRARLPSYE